MDIVALFYKLEEKKQSERTIQPHDWLERRHSLLGKAVIYLCV